MTAVKRSGCRVLKHWWHMSSKVARCYVCIKGSSIILTHVTYMVAAHNGWVSPSESLWSLGAEGRWQLTRWRKNIWDEIHYHTQVYIGAEYSSFINLVVHSFKPDVSSSLRNSFSIKSTRVKHLLENPKFILLTEDTQVHSILLHWSTCAYIQYHITYSMPLQQVILLMIVTDTHLQWNHWAELL